MGFFDQLFGNNDETKSEVSLWEELHNVEEYREALDHSFTKPILFFKHSTTCFISKTVLKNLESQISSSENKDKIDLYYLDLLHFRPISNLMANDLDLAHQSPQAILIKNGEVKYHASHESIDFEKAVNALS